MKLKVSKPTEDDPPKGKKLRIKNYKTVTSNYGMYSGIVTDEGKAKDNPTESEAMSTMAKYMKNNQSDQSDKPSNVYRPKFSHLTLLYNRKKNQNET